MERLGKAKFAKAMAARMRREANQVVMVRMAVDGDRIFPVQLHRGGMLMPVAHFREWVAFQMRADGGFAHALLPSRLRLLMGDNTELLDGRRLIDYAIQGEVSVVALPPRVLLWVNHPDGSFLINTCFGSTPIADVKDIIQSEKGGPRPTLIAVRAHADDGIRSPPTILEDGNDLAHYNLSGWVNIIIADGEEW